MQIDLNNAEYYQVAFQDFLDMNWASAITNLTKIMESDPNFAGGNTATLLYEAYSALGQQYYSAGFYSDAARTFPVGTISPQAQELIEVTKKALEAGISQAVPGNRISDISASVQKVVESAGFSVVRDFVGHGVGRSLHEGPQIANFGKRGKGPVIREGMTLAIEPMVNQGSWEIAIKDDGWTAVTADGSLSAHFEDSIAVMKGGPMILSAP